METPLHLLARARECFGRRAWADAHRAFAEADRAVSLEADDVERLGWCSALLAGDHEMLAEFERAHGLYLAEGRHEKAAWCAFWMGFRLLHLGEIGRGTGWCERAAELVECHGRPSVVSGYLLLPGLARLLVNRDFAEARTVAERAIELAVEFDDQDLKALAQSMLGRTLVRQGEFERGLALLDLSMLTASAETVRPTVTGVVYCAAISNCARVFALDRAREWTDALARFCEAQPQMVTFSGTCLVHCSEVHQASGDWEQARLEAERACERSPTEGTPDRGPLGQALYQRAELARLRGDFGVAEELYRRANECGQEPQPGLALLRLAQGKTDAAVHAVRRLLRASAGTPERLRLLPAAIEVLLGADLVEEVRPLVAELEASAAAYPTDVVRAMSAHAAGTLKLAEGSAESALAPLRASLVTWQAVGAPYLAARVRVELSRACRALGDEDGAELELTAARAVFERLDARYDLGRLAPPAAATSSGLTPRELEVLRLVATGKTNKSIAAELGLSEKTVDRHVSNIFVKVNVSSRAAATAHAYRHGLV